MNIVGTNIRRLREKSGLTLREVGEKIGYSAHYIWRVETGRADCSLEFLRRISEFFDVPLASLFFQPDSNLVSIRELLGHLPPHLIEWVQKLQSAPYIVVAAEAEEAGISPDALRQIVSALKNPRRKAPEEKSLRIAEKQKDY